MRQSRGYTFIFSLFLACLAFNALTASAQAQSDACEADRAKYCPMFRADDPRRLYCLKGVESQIKPSCKSTLRSIPGTEEEFIDECTEDYEKLCSSVAQGKGRVLKCLKENSKKLSFECRKKVSVFPDPR